MRWFRRQAPPEPDPSFLEVLEEHGLLAYERQAAFEEEVGHLDWELDQERRVLTLGNDLVLSAQLLGSEAVQAKTWRWAWANTTVEPDLAMESARAREIGEARDLGWLTDPEIDTSRTGDGFLLALATTGLLGRQAYFPCPYPGGVVYVLVDVPEGMRPPIEVTPDRVVHVISSVLGDAPRLTGRAFVERYLEKIGADIRPARDSIVLGDAATFRFDELGRLTNIDATLGPEP
jgi:hypothetical protein